MTNFIKKYKDRSPKDTINIIHEFFIKKNFNIQVDILRPTECGTWGCVVHLFSNGVRVMSANGKGASKDYALASGYAELFERFSNRLVLLKNPFLNKAFLSENFAKNKYYFHPEEKILDINNDILNNEDISYWFNSLFSSSERAKEYLYTQCPINFFGVPFQKYGEKEIKYYDPRIIAMIYNSSGLAAGNTLEEALIQGMSEIFEHYVGVHSFKEEFEEYYYIDHSTLPPYLQEIIEKIEQTGNTIRIFDLSYNFGLPVCMALLTNKYSYNFHMNFGSAPVFDIAVERTITELYQNKLTYLSIDNISEQSPFDSEPWYINEVKAFQSVSRLSRFPERFLFNGKKIQQFNTKVFKNSFQSYSNQELMEHYLKLCDTYNTSIYYMDNSFIPNMHAVQIFCPNFDLKIHEKMLFLNAPLKEKEDTLDYVLAQWELVNFMQQDTIDYQSLDNILNKLDTSKLQINPFIVGFLMGADWINPYGGTKGYKTRNLLDGIIRTNLPVNYILTSEIHSFCQEQARLYCTLYNFLNSKTLNKQQIEIIFNELSVNLPEDFYENGTSKAFLFHHIVINPYRKIVNSQAYKNYIKGVCD